MRRYALIGAILLVSLTMLVTLYHENARLRSERQTAVADALTWQARFNEYSAAVRWCVGDPAIGGGEQRAKCIYQMHEALGSKEYGNLPSLQSFADHVLWCLAGGAVPADDVEAALRPCIENGVDFYMIEPSDMEK